MNIDPDWDLATAFDKISAEYRPGSLTSGRARNVLIQMWGEVVGRNRALAELHALIIRSGSRRTFCKRFSIGHAALDDLQKHFHRFLRSRGAGGSRLVIG
jgi:hypothetical protein